MTTKNDTPPEGIDETTFTTDDSGRVVSLDRLVADKTLGDHPFSRPAQSRHINSPESVFEKIKNSSNEPVTVNLRCQFCNKLIDARSMRRHISMEHPMHHQQPRQKSENRSAHTSNSTSSSKMPDQLSKPKGKDTTGLVACPICNIPVRSDRLERHVQKVHNDHEIQASTSIEGSVNKPGLLSSEERLTGDTFMSWLNKIK